MQVDYRNYENAYANTSNRQLLLNLARMENSDPAYFFKLGQITSSYRMQASLTGAGQVVSTMSGTQVPTGGGTPGGIYENDPTFQFIPVNDDTNARLLLEPMQPETFYALYQQGWRLDQLFRLLVDRIEITRPMEVKGADGKIRIDCGVETIRNTPPLSLDNMNQESKDALSSYVTFLRVSALVYELQRQGHLVLGGSEGFVAYDKNAIIPFASAEGVPGSSVSGNIQPVDEKDTRNSGGTGKSEGLVAKDQNDAVAQKNVWIRSGNGWVLGHKVFRPVFFLTPKMTTTDATTHATTLVPDTDAIKQDLHLTELTAGSALDNALQVLTNGFSIENDQSQQETEEAVCSATPGTVGNSGQVKMSARLVMRSMIGLMAAASQEQKVFDELLRYPEAIPTSRYDDADVAAAPFASEVPKVEQEPLLRLNWHDTYTPKDTLVRLAYRGKEFQVADEENPAEMENAHWNRDVFRLINSLTSQVTVDISKFPLPEILQLHSD
jgi:hypothetical protein